MPPADAKKPRRGKAFDDSAAALPGLSVEPAPSTDSRAPEARADDPHYHGHRDRLRARFLEAGPDALQDYELLEMALFQVDRRKDVKPLAKELLKAFGGLWAVFNAPPEKLRGFGAGGVRIFTDAHVAAIRIVGAAALRAQRQEVMNKPVLSSWNALLEYCSAAMAHETTEQFRLLFLDRKNQLIADEVQQRGTVDHTPVYPREVARRALELGATALILVHNHPSGDPTPSRADIEMTKEVARALKAVGVTVHDHIIVGKGRHASFKGMGLM